MINRLALLFLLLVGLVQSVHAATAGTVALRKAGAFTDIQSWCDDYTSKNYPNYRCLKADGSSPVAEDVAPSYTWYGYACSKPESGANLCTSYFTTTPSRYCANGATPYTGVPANGESSNDKYCPGGPPPPNCTDKNPFVIKVSYGPQNGSLAPDHVGQCVTTPQELLRCYTDGATKTKYCFWQVVRTGETYTGTDVPGNGAGGTGPVTPDAPSTPSDKPTPSPPIKAPPNAPPGANPCPTGSVAAGIDSSGITICMGTGSNPPPTPKPPVTTSAPTTTTNADGSTDAKTTSTQSNSDGTTTTTTTTTHTGTDGSTATSSNTVTSTTASGATGKTDANPDDAKYDLCKQNPNLTVCMNSTVAGTCGAVSCTGDAIQCATLRAASAMQCQQHDDIEALKASASKTLGDAILSGADPQKSAIDAAIKGTDVDLSKPTLDQGGFVGGAACLSNRTISVMGRSIEVDFSRVCSDIQPLRTVVMACAFILAYLIVSRSVLQS